MRLKKWLAAGLAAAVMAGAYFVRAESGGRRAEVKTAGAQAVVKIETTAEPVKPPIPAFAASEKIPLEPWLQFKLRQIAEENGVPFPLAVAVIEVESTFRADAENGGCYGLMQVSEIHAPRDVLLDPVDNMRHGCYLLGAHYRKHGDWHKALTVYNRGEAGAMGLRETAYSHKVLNAAERWKNVLERS